MNSKQEYTNESPKPKKRSFLFYPLMLLLFGALGAGSIFISRELLEKGEVRLPLPKEAAKAVNDNLSPEKDGRLGPLRVTDMDRPSAPLMNEHPAPLPPPPPPSSGNVVGEYIKEETHRPSTSGFVVPPEKSAITLVKPASPPLPDVPASGWSKPAPERARQINPPQARSPLPETAQPIPVRDKITAGSDGVVTLDFVDDLASYLAENYWPRGSHLIAKERDGSTVSVSSLNQRYGSELIGFAATRMREGRRDYHRDRALLLNYAFTPTMIPALTRLYADQLADNLVENARAQRRSINGRDARLQERDVVSMLRLYAAYSNSVGMALLAYAENSSVREALESLTQAEESGFKANNDMLESRYRLELTGEKESPRRESRARLEKAERDYRAAMQEISRVKDRIVRLMSNGQYSAVENDGLIYLAAWAARRGSRAEQSLLAAAEAADYLGRVLLEKADYIEAGSLRAAGKK